MYFDSGSTPDFDQMIQSMLRGCRSRDRMKRKGSAVCFGEMLAVARLAYLHCAIVTMQSLFDEPSAAGLAIAAPVKASMAVA